ncbi:hypothetical protein T484DRAFT_1759852 [Baffinella frigidus]|nr:hypothetical protein T484DRAFT_1759852 [Cryptophyta sp. CCMP2293]
MDIFAEEGAGVKDAGEGAGGEGGGEDAMEDGGGGEVLPANVDPGDEDTEGEASPDDEMGAPEDELMEGDAAPEDAPEDGGEDSGRGSPELGSYGYPGHSLASFPAMEEPMNFSLSEHSQSLARVLVGRDADEESSPPPTRSTRKDAKAKGGGTATKAPEGGSAASSTRGRGKASPAAPPAATPPARGRGRPPKSKPSPAAGKQAAVVEEEEEEEKEVEKEEKEEEEEEQPQRATRGGKRAAASPAVKAAAARVGTRASPGGSEKSPAAPEKSAPEKPARAARGGRGEKAAAVQGDAGEGGASGKLGAKRGRAGRESEDSGETADAEQDQDAEGGGASSVKKAARGGKAPAAVSPEGGKGAGGKKRDLGTVAAARPSVGGSPLTSAGTTRVKALENAQNMASQRQTRPSKDNPGKTVMLAGRSAERAIQAGVVQRLGGRSVYTHHYDPKVTHMLVREFRKTEKVLCACAAGKWILKTTYLESCGRFSEWVKEHAHEWNNPRKRWRSYWELHGHGPFHGQRFLLCPDTHPPTEILELVVKAGGGETEVMQAVSGAAQVVNRAKSSGATHVVAADGSQAAGAALVAQLRTGGVELVTGNYLTELLMKQPVDGQPVRPAEYRPIQPEPPKGKKLKSAKAVA